MNNINFSFKLHYQGIAISAGKEDDADDADDPL